MRLRLDGVKRSADGVERRPDVCLRLLRDRRQLAYGVHHVDDPADERAKDGGERVHGGGEVGGNELCRRNNRVIQEDSQHITQVPRARREVLHMLTLRASQRVEEVGAQTVKKCGNTL